MADSAALSREYAPAEGERIGFCFPVHGWRPPLPVRGFISKAKLRADKSAFCYCVCTAGDDIGETVKILKHDLAGRGIALHSAWSLVMPESYVGLPFMDVDTPEKEKSKKETAAETLKEIKRHVIDRRQGVFGLVEGRWPRVNSRFLGSLFIKCLLTDKPFRADKERCLKCGRCASVCPMGNISMDESRRPAWHNDGSCIACFACYHHCPAHCISYGQRTKGKGQYFFNKPEDRK